MPKLSDRLLAKKANLLKKSHSGFNKIKLLPGVIKAIFAKKRPEKIAENELNNFDCEEEILNNIDSFSEKTVEDVMIPRSDIIAVKQDVTMHELSELIIKHAHTRTLIYKENLDNIIGFVNIKDLFEVVIHAKKFNLKKIMRKHLISTHSMRLVDLLSQMQASRTHIAVVVDEYGGTDGIITIEDIIEEIVGRISDEHDLEQEVSHFEILRPGLIIANARLEVEELEAITGLELKNSDDEFDTIGGLIMAKTGSVPIKGSVVEIDETMAIEIIDSTSRRIKKVKITHLVQ